MRPSIYFEIIKLRCRYTYSLHETDPFKKKNRENRWIFKASFNIYYTFIFTYLHVLIYIRIQFNSILIFLKYCKLKRNALN